MSHSKEGQPWPRSRLHVQYSHHDNLIASVAAKFLKQDFLFLNSKLKRNQWKLHFSGGVSRLQLLQNHTRILQLWKDWRSLLQGEFKIIWGIQSRRDTDVNDWGAPFRNRPFSTRETWGATSPAFLSSPCNSDLIGQGPATSLGLGFFICKTEMKILRRMWIMDTKMLCEFHSDC